MKQKSSAELDVETVQLCYRHASVGGVVSELAASHQEEEEEEAWQPHDEEVTRHAAAVEHWGGSCDLLPQVQQKQVEAGEFPRRAAHWAQRQ